MIADSLAFLGAWWVIGWIVTGVIMVLTAIAVVLSAIVASFGKKE